MRSSPVAHPRNAAAEHALGIYLAAVDAVRADRLVSREVRRQGDMLRARSVAMDLNAVRYIYIVGAGKAAHGMVTAVEEILGGRIAGGVVVTKDGHAGPTRTVRMLEAGHPVPDERSVEAGQEIHDLASRAGPKDLVICLISGGASALMELPEDGVSLADLRATTEALLRCGATINELNSVRACLSRLKAGGLARAAFPARVLCLVLSDVLGNPLDVIGSGPCVSTPRSPAAALAVVDKYGLRASLPDAVIECLAQPAASTGRRNRTVSHVIVGDIWSALDGAVEEAVKCDLRPYILTGCMQGEAREVGKVFGAIARDTARTSGRTGPNCLIAGGETTVTVQGAGKGGRSQELGLSAAVALMGTKNVALLAAGTDGTDGPTDAAGALVDGETIERAARSGHNAMDALRRNDSYPCLVAAGDLIVTGPTDSNVGDLVIVVSTPSG